MRLRTRLSAHKLVRKRTLHLLTAAMLSFIEESRRIDNRKMREELGVALLYPDLDSGLAAMGKLTD